MQLAHNLPLSLRPSDSQPRTLITTPPELGHPYLGGNTLMYRRERRLSGTTVVSVASGTTMVSVGSNATQLSVASGATLVEPSDVSSGA